jgi:hypothetical protein
MEARLRKQRFRVECLSMETQPGVLSQRYWKRLKSAQSAFDSIPSYPE